MTTQRTIEPTHTTASRPSAAGRAGATPARRMSPLLLVLMRELRVRGLSAGYIVSSVVLLGIIVAAIVVPTLLSGSTTYPIGVVGQGNQPVLDAAATIANLDAPDDEQTTFDVTTFPDTDTAGEAVRDGQVDAALVAGTEVLVERAGGFGGNDLLGLLQRAAGDLAVQDLVDPADVPAVQEALAGQALQVTALSGQDAAQSDGRGIIAYGGVVLTYMMILQYGMWTLTGVAEEKSNRVLEILLATARPWQLFAGKVIGIALLGMIQFIVTVVAAITAIRVSGALDLPAIPVDFIATLTLWVVLGFALYMTVFGAAGALTSKPEDAQSTATPITIVVLLAFFGSFAVLGNPDGTLAHVGTFVPFWAPFAVPVRAALGALPLWQGIAAVILSLGTIAALTAFSAKVYRGGSLYVSGRMRWRQALRNADA